MKQLEKIQMKNFREMTEKEMKHTTGGYDSYGVTSPKIEACKGKKEGDPCSFMYNNRECPGRCRRYALDGTPDGTLHCSDLR
jgi:bacteriocin-like protein